MASQQKKTGISRVVAALFYSLAGLRTAFKSEAAFRQELFLYVALLPLLFLMPAPVAIKCVLLLANTLVLVVELINSAIESIVDLASPDYHLLAKHAKDIGSAAVLISLSAAIFLWVYTLYHIYNGF